MTRFVSNRKVTVKFAFKLKSFLLVILLYKQLYRQGLFDETILALIFTLRILERKNGMIQKLQ